ncbi:MAG: hypothetical protein KDC13_03735, partial [Bacteroidetes bacterium]|nr:hypothetical protein [Bacteroidota bacterium]
MKKLYCFAALTLLSFSLFTQTNDCSLQEIPETYRNYMIETGQFVQNSASSRQGATRDIALNLILVVYDDGPLVTPQLVQQKVDSANVIYSPIGIRFQICSIRYVDYPGYLSFIPGYITWSNEIENAVLQEGYLPGYLNIIYGSGDGPNATLPGIYNGDRILMNAGPNRVFTHEIGHYFSLWHTHAFNGYSTNIYTLELVDGSNCETEGDFICDTPADPGLHGRASAFPDCQYTDTVSTDANGDLYQPDVNNYMSAAPPGCQIQFTQGQYDRMAYALYHERAVLKTGQAGVTMHEIPMKMCITDDPVALSSDIPGGVFSGNGVTGNFFDPALAGPGNHIITYTANTTEEVVETTDQFCAYHDTAFSSSTIWQSFTAEIEGLLTGMAFSLQAAEASSVHYSILEGSGTGGNLIDEGDFTVETGEGFDWVRFNPG